MYTHILHIYMYVHKFIVSCNDIYITHNLQSMIKYSPLFIVNPVTPLSLIKCFQLSFAKLVYP